MKAKLFSIVLACVAVATLFCLTTDSAYADYPQYRGRVQYGNSHVYRNQSYRNYGYRNVPGYINFGGGVVSIGRGGVGITFGNNYAGNRFRYAPNYWGPYSAPNYRVPVTPYVVPRYNNGAVRQFYYDPSDPYLYQRNTLPATPYIPPTVGNGVDRYEFLRFQQETRDALRQLGDQQRRTENGQRQLERGQQQLDLEQRRLQREQDALERELQQINNRIR